MHCSSSASTSTTTNDNDHKSAATATATTKYYHYYDDNNAVSSTTYNNMAGLDFSNDINSDTALLAFIMASMELFSANSVHMVKLSSCASTELFRLGKLGCYLGEAAVSFAKRLEYLESFWLVCASSYEEGRD